MVARTTDACRSPPSSVAASGACGATRVAAAWAGVVTTTASAVVEWSAVRTTQSSSDRSIAVTLAPVRTRSPSRLVNAATRRPMPPTGALKTGAAGSSASWARRSVASRPSAWRAAASRPGAMVVQLSSSARPALTPPISGSTRRSKTASPTHDRITVPTLRSPSGRGELGRPAPARRCRSAAGRIPGATTDGSSGTPSTLGEGMGRIVPSNQSEACRAAGATNSSARPSSAHRSVAHGTLTRKASAPSSTSVPIPVSGLVRRLPPARSSASRTVTARCGWSTASRWAVLRPVMPAPTTTTRRPSMDQPPSGWAWTWSTTWASTPGSISGRTPWPRLKTCPGWPALRRSTSATSASTTSRGPRHTAGSRFP